MGTVLPPRPSIEENRCGFWVSAAYHPAIEARGISEDTCELLGIGYLPQGRSPLKGRIVFQVADARAVNTKGDPPSRVILSHLGRAASDDTDPKYLFYQGFHKSAELYGQELLWLHEDAADQAQTHGGILLTEGPFDVAKAAEAGFRNVVGAFGAALSTTQAGKLANLARHLGVDTIRIAFDRDEAGQSGALKAAALIEQAGLKAQVFDWDASVARRNKCARGGCGPVASDLEAQFQLTVADAQKVLDQVVSLTEADEGNSELLARMVTTFESLGLFGAGRQILLPLFLAISLELGALFGPALLLRRRT